MTGAHTETELTVVLPAPGNQRGEVVEPSEAGPEGDTVSLQDGQYSLHLLPGDLVLVLQSNHQLLVWLVEAEDVVVEGEEVAIEAGVRLSEL